MSTTNTFRQPLEQDALEARFAVRVSAQLSAGAESVPHDISERLRVAREQAVGRARSIRLTVARLETEPSFAVVRQGGALALGGEPMEGSKWFKLVSIVPLLLLLAGLLLIQQWHSRSQIAAAAEVDAELLSDNLPPNAYSDAGFSEFLKMPTQAAD